MDRKKLEVIHVPAQTPPHPKVDKETLRKRLLVVEQMVQLALLEGWQVKTETDDKTGEVSLVFTRVDRLPLTYNFSETAQIEQSRVFNYSIKAILKKL